MKKVLILLLLPMTFFSQSTAKEINVAVKKHLGLLSRIEIFKSKICIDYLF